MIGVDTVDIIAHCLRQALRLCLPDRPMGVTISVQARPRAANTALSRDEISALFAQELGQRHR